MGLENTQSTQMHLEETCFFPEGMVLFCLYDVKALG